MSTALRGLERLPLLPLLILSMGGVAIAEPMPLPPPQALPQAALPSPDQPPAPAPAPEPASPPVEAGIPSAIQPTAPLATTPPVTAATGTAPGAAVPALNAPFAQTALPELAKDDQRSLREAPKVVLNGATVRDPTVMTLRFREAIRLQGRPDGQASGKDSHAEPAMQAPELRIIGFLRGRSGEALATLVIDNTLSLVIHKGTSLSYGKDGILIDVVEVTQDKVELSLPSLNKTFVLR